MSLVRYEPWVGVRQLQDDINRLFSGLSTGDSSGATADWVPNVDINEFEDKFQLYVDLPGVDPVVGDRGVDRDVGDRGRIFRRRSGSPRGAPRSGPGAGGTMNKEFGVRNEA